jgi:ABC-2 type transport system ATP-binding protein
VLLTTHYLAEADALADRIVVIDRGRIVAEGTPQAIKARAAGRRVRCHTSIDIDDIAAMPHVINVRRDNGTTEIATTDSDAVVRVLLARDPALANIEIAGADLEEAFVALTERN